MNTESMLCRAQLEHRDSDEDGDERPIRHSRKSCCSRAATRAIFHRTSYAPAERMPSPSVTTTIWFAPSRHNLKVNVPLRMRHLFRNNGRVKLLPGQEAKAHRSLAQGHSFLMSLLSDLGCFVIANDWVESSDEHQRIIEMVLNLFTIRLQTFDTKFAKTIAGIGQQVNR